MSSNLSITIKRMDTKAVIYTQNYDILSKNFFGISIGDITSLHHPLFIRSSVTSLCNVCVHCNMDLTKNKGRWSFDQEDFFYYLKNIAKNNTYRLDHKCPIRGVHYRIEFRYQ